LHVWHAVAGSNSLQTSDSSCKQLVHSSQYLPIQFLQLALLLCEHLSHLRQVVQLVNGSYSEHLRNGWTPFKHLVHISQLSPLQFSHYWILHFLHFLHLEQVSSQSHRL